MDLRVVRLVRDDRLTEDGSLRPGRRNLLGGHFLGFPDAPLPSPSAFAMLNTAHATNESDRSEQCVSEPGRIPKFARE